VLPREDLLKRSENRELAARLVDLAEQALKTWEPALSHFLSPPEQFEAQRLFQGLADVAVVTGGGYPQAERRRVGFNRSELGLLPEQIEVAALDIAGNFLFDSATHRDFLGSILGTGITRDKVGDIVVLGERGAQVLIVPELAEFLCSTLVQVRSVPVKVSPIALTDLKVRPPQRKELTTVEASMRLDAIASAGFGMSRSKMADLIGSGDVRVNWKTITTASHALQSGDLVAVSGKGRLEIGEVAVTKKERYRIQLTRFI
jgi:photosystem II S4 domain protein